MASSTSGTRAAQRATKTIPIVMVGVSNAVGNGFVASLAKPGSNITGVSNQREEVLGKPIGILHEVKPGARRIAILLNESNSSYGWNWAAAQSACAALDLVALRVVASVPAQLGAAVEQIVRQQSQAVVVIPDPLLQRAYQTARADTGNTTAGGLRDASTWSQAGCSATQPISPRTIAPRRRTWTRF